MGLETIARIAVENTAYSFDMLFDYSVPLSLLDKILPGMRVLVSFGNSKKKRVGIVFNLDVLKNTEKKLKKIDSILDKKPLLTNEMLKTASFIRERTFCTYFDACKLFLPLGLSLNIDTLYAANLKYDSEMSKDENKIYEYLKKKNRYISDETIILDCNLKNKKNILDEMYSKGIILRNIDTQRRTGDATIRMVHLTQNYLNDIENYKITKKQQEIIDVLNDVSTASIKELCYFTGVSSAVISALENKGVIEITEDEIYRAPYETHYCENNEEIILSEEQQNAFNGLLDLYNNIEPKGALLYGVTGSGKTQVYLKLIDKALKTNRGIIVMIPEISLTPQILSLFYNRYGKKVAVFHSALSLGQRLDEWKRIKRGEAKIAVGTRSAVFAPFDDIGLIIIDEEQEHTYKSEMTPRYDARDVATFRIGKHNGLLVLASATPSIKSYTKAQTGSYSLFELSNRYGTAKLPKVEIIDTTYESDMVIENISKRLAEEIKLNFDKGKQSILLLNRRGYNTFASCSECGTVRTCPNCSISLTYHIKNGRLMCHYCGYSTEFSTKCPNCHNDSVKFLGSGTQKLEEELKLIVPDAKILRMDTDTTVSRFSYEEKFKSFQDGEYDILVGTQMVAKGLNFPNVTLVGVLSVDLMLFNDDYKSGERAFDLITQVVGRSGRGKSPGKAFIQTAFPESEIITLAKEQDYKSFYNIELPMRKEMIYPPFCDICVIGFSGENESLLDISSNYFFNKLKELHQKKYKNLDIIVLGPVVPRIFKIGGKFRSRIIIKCRNDKHFRLMIKELLVDFSKNKKYNNISIFADINPENTM